jgi:hypothetical protein
MVSTRRRNNRDKSQKYAIGDKVEVRNMGHSSLMSRAWT